MTNNAYKKRRILLNKRYLISLLLVFVLVIVSACGNEDEPKAIEKENSTEKEGEIEMPEPDLEGIPEVVAEVNGSKISGEDFEVTYTNEFQQAAMQAQMSGEDVDQDQLKGQIVEGLIGQELLMQGADKGNFEASEDAIDETLAGLAKQNGMETTEDFLTALEESGMTEEEVMGQVAIQVKIDALIKSELGEIDTSEEALQKVYDNIKAQQEEAGAEDFPSFEEAKPDLVQFVTSEKEAETVQALVEKYREDAEITINL